MVCTSSPGERASDSSCFCCGLTEGKARAALWVWGLPPQGRLCLVHPDASAAACPRRGLGQVTWPRYASVSAFVKSWAHWGHSHSHENDDLNFPAHEVFKGLQKLPWVTSLSQLGPEWRGDSVVLLYNIVFVLKSELEGLPWWSSDLDSTPSMGHTRKIPHAM